MPLRPYGIAPITDEMEGSLGRSLKHVSRRLTAASPQLFKTRGAREPKSKPLVEKTKCVRFESCGGWSKFLVPATDIHSQKQL